MLASLAFAAPASAADLEFTDWTDVGGNVASGTLRGVPISFSGTNVPTYGSTTDGSSTVFSSSYFEPPLAHSDAPGFYSYEGWSYTIQFGAPTTDPVIHLYTLASRLTFPPGTQITKVSGDSGFSVSDNVVIGTLAGSTDANGTVRIGGTYDSLTFSTERVYGGPSPDGILFQIGGPPYPLDTFITDGPEGTVYDPNVQFSFDSTLSGSTFECQLDGGGFAPCSSPYAPAPQPVGQHVFEVRAIGPDSSVDPTPARREFAVSAEPNPPDTTITEAPASLTFDPNVRFSFSSTIPGSTFQCRLDDAGFAPCGSPYAPGTLPEGAHAFEVRAVSPEGKLDPTPAKSEFTISGPLSYGADCGLQYATAWWRFGDTYWLSPSGWVDGTDRPPWACVLARHPATCPYYFDAESECAGNDFCQLRDKCVWRDLACPTDAYCRIVVRTSWYDADPGIDWHAWAVAAFGLYENESKPSDLEKAVSADCHTGTGGDRCTATAKTSQFGDGTPARGRCGAADGSYYPQKQPLGSDGIRRFECSLEFYVEPPAPVSVAVILAVFQVFAPGGGFLAIAPTVAGTAASAQADAARARRPRIAKISKVVTERGPVTIKPMLNKPAKRLLRRRGKLKVKLNIRFQGTDGTVLKRTRRVTLKRRASKLALRCAFLPPGDSRKAKNKQARACTR